jgi:uncharacterized flavoprotein (TIGR03862 family)
MKHGGKSIAIVGGGPAGLRAAEIAVEGGAAVTLFDAKASVGRKLLVAGRGGLNLTKEEPVEEFASHYLGEGAGRWADLIAECGPAQIRAWAAGLGVETFAASTGRVYPRELKAAPLLRRWVRRLRGEGVDFAMGHGLSRIEVTEIGTRIVFRVEDGLVTHDADAVILALGGGSWPQTGSDGTWTAVLQRSGVAVAPLAPANCGWECAWPADVLAACEGRPLKNIAAMAGATRVEGELLVTAYGLEGGAIYALGAALRTMEEPAITIDFKPSSTQESLIAKMNAVHSDFLHEARARWRLSDAACAILAHGGSGQFDSAATLAAAVKAFPIRLTGPRPIAEAISSAGGVRWSELDAGLMIARLPGVFVAGEMIDWEAPTGGYLLQGCFATGTRAGRAALAWCAGH